MAIQIRVLRPADDRTGFRSGDPDLDRFFIRYSGQNQFKHHIGTTWVAEEEGRLLGYATIAAGHVEVEDLPGRVRKRLPHYPLPVLRLARLAVDESARGRGVGRSLLWFVCEVALQMAGAVGCVGIVVDAKPGAIPFYKSFGFEIIDVVEGALGDRPRPLPMFLPLAMIPPSENE